MFKGVKEVNLVRETDAPVNTTYYFYNANTYGKPILNLYRGK